MLGMGNMKIVGPGEPGDPLRGLSVHFLSARFVENLSDAGFTVDNRVYEIEEKVIRGLSQTKVCPRDGGQGSAFVDAVDGDDNVGRAGFMLSYTWGYKLRDIIESLSNFCKGKELDPKRTYIWICCLCINQHRVKEAAKRGVDIPFEQFSQEFGSRVKGIGHVLALMAPWNGPAYIKRVWCVYEVYIATSSDSDVKLDIIMPPEEACGFVGYAEDSSWGLNKCVLWESLKKVRVEKAEASVDQDRKNIISLIEKGPGCCFVNQKVMNKLQLWVSEACWAKAHSLLEGSDVELGGLASARVARFFVELGQPEKAVQLLNKGQDKLASIEASVAKAAIMTIMGFVKQQRGDSKGAFSDFQEAYRIRQAANALDTSDAAELLECMGVAEAKHGDFEIAKQHLTRAITTRTNTNSLNTPDGAGLLANLGLVHVLNTELEEAISCFDQARQIRNETNTLDTPRGGHLIALRALVAGKQGQHDVALGLCKEARQIFEAVGALETKRGADLSLVNAFVFALSGDRQQMTDELAKQSDVLEMLESKISAVESDSMDKLLSVGRTPSYTTQQITRVCNQRNSCLITLLE